jgi:hemerythrin
MALITWSDKFSVRIKSIDDQHKLLITMINDFYDNIVNRSNQENVSKLLISLKKYTQEHFSLEENYMKKFHYSSYDTHKREHDFFIAKIEGIEENISNGKLVLSLDITSFLFDWLKKHIQGTDQRYSDFFIQKGVK